MNNDHNIVTFIFALIPYIFATWIYTELTSGDWETFFIALGVLLAVRLFFSTIETLGSVLTWRLYGKKLLVEKIMCEFRFKLDTHSTANWTAIPEQTGH